MPPFFKKMKGKTVPSRRKDLCWVFTFHLPPPHHHTTSSPCPPPFPTHPHPLRGGRRVLCDLWPSLMRDHRGYRVLVWSPPGADIHLSPVQRSVKQSIRCLHPTFLPARVHDGLLSGVSNEISTYFAFAGPSSSVREVTQCRAAVHYLPYQPTSPREKLQAALGYAAPSGGVTGEGRDVRNVL